MPQGRTQLRTACLPPGLGVIPVVGAIPVTTGTSSLTFVSVTPGYASTEVEVKMSVESGSISLFTAE